MPDVKFSQLTPITAAQSADYIPIVDVSDPLMSENGSNAVISIGDLTSSLFDGMANGSISISKLQANPTFTGNVTLPSTTSIGEVGATEIGFLSGLRNNIQYQLDNPFFPVPGTLTIGPGTTTNAPLRLMAGTNLATPVSGSVEFDGTNLYYTNSTPARQILATKTYVDAAVSSIIDGAPDLLNTLNEISIALTAKAPLASPTFTGTVTLPTGTVTSDMIVNSTIVNADISLTAAIAGTKISPNFGSGNVITTGSLTVGDDAQFISRIGTTNVTPQSQVLGANDSAGALFGRFSNDGASSRHSFIKSRSTTRGAHSIVWAGDDLGMIAAGGSDGVKIVEATRIHSEVDAAVAVAGGSFVVGKRYRIVALGNTVWADVGWVAVPPATNPAVGDFFTATAPGTVSTGTASEEPKLDVMPGRLIFSTTGRGAATVTQRMHINSDGNVGINTTTVDPSCLLQLTSTAKGFRPPAMTTSQRNLITSPIAGLMIYNSSTNKLNFYNGNAWEAVTSTPA